METIDDFVTALSFYEAVPRIFTLLYGQTQ